MTENREELDIFLDSPRVQVYLIDDNTAEYYSEILNNLKQIGKLVPINDLWIAATAFQNGLKIFLKTNILIYTRISLYREIGRANCPPIY